MYRKLINTTLLLTAVTASFFACSDDDDVKPNLRTKVDYSTITAESDYSDSFTDAEGASTVDFTEGNQRLKMFIALNSYVSSSTSAGTEIDAAKLKSLFSNTGNPFTDFTYQQIFNISGSELNNSGIQLKATVASSLADANATEVRTKIESLFDEIDAASASLASTATKGQAGKLGNYLVDAKGIEIAQVIQKSLIGAMQLDYISNVLLDEGLNADNYQEVGEHNYTQLEHNWDVAYGFLTLNPIYLQGSTDDKRNTIEFGAGSYIWEYNKANYAKIYPAFLKGRAAIVNNDKAELATQATFIRTEFENALANAALGYLNKWKTAAPDASGDAARAHAMGEGLGFIYALRFATLHNADAAFSDDVINGLIGSSNGFWDLNTTKINTASDAIKAKFGVQ